MWFVRGMTRVLIDFAKADDLDAILHLLLDDRVAQAREDSSETARYAYQDGFAAALADPNCKIFVAKAHEQIVGSLQLNIISGLSYRGKKRALIEDMRIHRMFRQQGIGRNLLETALSYARQADCGLAELFVHQTRSDAHAFYAACGFEGSHVGFRKML